MKVFFGGEEERTSFYTVDAYKAELAGRSEQEVTQDSVAMEQIGDAEGYKLTNAVEQSPNPEKGATLKKALKAMTIGVVMLTSTLGGMDKARGASNFIESQVKQPEISANVVANDAKRISQVEHEDGRELEELKKDNAELESVVAELMKGAHELTSIDQSVFLGGGSSDSVLSGEFLEKGLLSQKSYDRHVKLVEQLHAEADAAYEKDIQQKRAKWEDFEKIGISDNEQLSEAEAEAITELKKLMTSVKEMDMATSKKMQDGGGFFAVNDALGRGLISQESYNKWIESVEQLKEETGRELTRIHKEEMQQRANMEFEKTSESREELVQERARLAKQETLKDAQEYNKMLNDEMETLLEVISNL